MTEIVSKPLALQMRAIGLAARNAARALRTAATEAKNKALIEAAAAIRASVPAILAANQEDIAKAEDLSPALRDRLTLDQARIEAMAKGIEAIAALADPVGRELARWDRPNGLEIVRVATPIGVLGIIYESRPNVTADAAALCLKSGNAVILRGGSESLRSSIAILAAMRAGLVAAKLPVDAVQMVPTTDRAAVGLMLAGLDDCIDLIVPRGGKSLVQRVQEEARVPVLAHLEGICHVYVHEQCDPAKARAVALNAKLRRPAVCGAAETFLFDRTILDGVGAAIIDDLIARGCEVRGDHLVRALRPGDIVEAGEEDWRTEYLDAIVSIKSVNGVEEAIRHIETYGSHHTDAIVTEDAEIAARFLDAVDSAIVIWNASTQFADGGEFGMGGEIGIATGKLHARGPVGVEQLTTFKYLVLGNGQVRP